MSTATNLNTTLITLRHPAGNIRISVPSDVPLGELMADFLEVTGQPDHDGWALSPAGGDPYPGQNTLAQLRVGDGAVLCLHEAPSRAPAESHSALTRQPHPSPALAITQDADQRPLRDRTARALPVKLSRLARSRAAMRALTGTAAQVPSPAAHVSSTPGPASFTRPARLSPSCRIRDAWAQNDYRHRLDQMILGPRLRRCVTIAVVSPKGGVGKTTTSALLGSLLAFLRRDRVIAVETNPDWGSLGRRLVPEHQVFIDDLLTGPLTDGQLTSTELDAQLGRGPDGLMVAPAPTDPERAAKLDEAAYRTLLARLGERVGTLVLDCGTGLDDPPARAALACADQLVLVCDDEPDTASIVAEAAQWLQGTPPPLVLVVNNLRRCSRIDLPALERATRHAHGLAVIPRHERAARALHDSRFSWNHAPAGWHTPVRELAALLTADWRELELSADARQRC